jgi:hypothetical protein
MCAIEDDDYNWLWKINNSNNFVAGISAKEWAQSSRRKRVLGLQAGSSCVKDADVKLLFCHSS